MLPDRQLHQLQLAEEQLLNVLEHSDQMVLSLSKLLNGDEAAEDQVASHAQLAVAQLTSACGLIAGQVEFLYDYTPFERSNLESLAKTESAQALVQTCIAALDRVAQDTDPSSATSVPSDSPTMTGKRLRASEEKN